jgi:tRNA threonylcarbamoyl adenosine modification protein YeaZ
MKILALEFSSAQRSVAAWSGPPNNSVAGKSNNEDIGAKSCRDGIASREKGPPTEHRSTRQLAEVVETGVGATGALTMIDEVLRNLGWEREQIECLAIGLGPGSYTGIRGSIALAQGWQLACGVRLLGISSAECLAWQARAEGLAGPVNIVIDAQRGEFYVARYELGAAGCREIAPLRLVTRAEVDERDQAGEVLIGPGIKRWFPTGWVMFPSAAVLAGRAAGRNDFAAGETIKPIYLRETTFVKAPPPRRLS